MSTLRHDSESFTRGLQSGPAAEFGQNGVFKSLDDSYSLHQKRPEHVDYIRELEGRSFIEQYREGNLSLIFQVPTEGNRDVVGRLLSSSRCAYHPNFPKLIYYLDASDRAEFNDGQEKSVFVINVQDMNRPDRTFPSVVRLYMVKNIIEKNGSGAVYFNPTKRSFNLFSYKPDGEFGLIVDARRAKLGDNRHPSMIESAMEIMDSISEHQGDIVDDLVSIREVMLQHFVSTIRVYLDCSRINIWQSKDSFLHFGDVLLGPVDFTARTGEGV